jgi:thiol-disulfide isomerase/thioredoxin
MSKRFLFFLITFAAALSLVIGFATARSTLVVRAKSALSHRASAPPAPVHQIPRAQDDNTRVIRFVSNPEQAPPFLMLDVAGNPVSSAAWKGKVVILNFWATWCSPCREEIPEMIDLANRYKDRLQIVGASVDDSDPSEVKAFADKAGINYPVVMAGRDLPAEYGGVPALPTTFVIDTQGRVVQKHVGLYPTDVYETEIRALLGLPVNGTIETFQDTGQIFLKNAALATELPGVSLKDLNADQKKAALKSMNMRNCDCGCALTIAQCRMNDTECPISEKLAAQIVKDASAKTAAPAATAPTSNR